MIVVYIGQAITQLISSIKNTIEMQEDTYMQLERYSLQPILGTRKQTATDWHTKISNNSHKPSHIYNITTESQAQASIK